MTLIDAYCLYNRARGTDLASPQDVFIAASMFNKLNLKLNLRELKSKVLVFESGIIFIFAIPSRKFQ